MVAAFGVRISAGTSQVVSAWISLWQDSRQPASISSALR
jgi:hypothetical protein